MTNRTYHPIRRNKLQRLSVWFSVLLLLLLAALAVGCGDEPAGDTHTAHSWGAWEVTRAATCSAVGEEARTCTVCGVTDTRPLPTAEHDWGTWQTVVIPTCEGEGRNARVCSACGARDEEPVPAKGHTYAADWESDAVAHWRLATCAHTDLVGDQGDHTPDENGVCTVCGRTVGDGQLSYSSDGRGGWRVTGRGNCPLRDIVIPATHAGKPVTAIARGAFSADPYLESLVIESGVTTIADAAFGDCPALRRVVLPDTLTSVGDTAFSRTGVTELTAPAAVFVYFPVGSLTAAVVTSGETLPENALYGAAELKSVSLPVTLRRVEAGAFYGCGALDEVRYAGSVSDWLGVTWLSSPLFGAVTVRFGDGVSFTVPAYLPTGDRVSANAPQTQPDSLLAASVGDVTNDFPSLRSITEKGRYDTPIYGIYAQAGDYAAYASAIRDLGFSCVRTVMDNSSTQNDIAFRQMALAGQSVMVTVGLSADPYLREGGRPTRIEDYDVEAWLAANVEHALAILRRYGTDGTFFDDYPECDGARGTLAALEVFNEPNFGYLVSYREGGAGGTAGDAIRQALYRRVHARVAEAVRAEFPYIRIVGFGAGGASAADTGFISSVVSGGRDILQQMDVVSTHPYLETCSPFAAGGFYSVAGQVEKIRDVVGRDLPIWFTECGFAVKHSEGGYYETEHGSDKLTQAAMLTQEYLLGMRLGIERITYMYIRDTDNCNYGLVERDGTYRPAAYAIRTMTGILPDPLLTRAVRENENRDGVFVYEIERVSGGDTVTVAFSATKKTTAEFAWSAPYALVTDLWGTTTLIPARNGTLTLTVGPCLQYLVPVSFAAT